MPFSNLKKWSFGRSYFLCATLFALTKHDLPRVEFILNNSVEHKGNTAELALRLEPVSQRSTVICSRAPSNYVTLALSS